MLCHLNTVIQALSWPNPALAKSYFSQKSCWPNVAIDRCDVRQIVVSARCCVWQLFCVSQMFYWLYVVMAKCLFSQICNRNSVQSKYCVSQKVVSFKCFVTHVLYQPNVGLDNSIWKYFFIWILYWPYIALAKCIYHIFQQTNVVTATCCADQMHEPNIASTKSCVGQRLYQPKFLSTKCYVGSMYLLNLSYKDEFAISCIGQKLCLENVVSGICCECQMMTRRNVV